MTELWIPNSAKAKYRCDVCGTEFGGDEEERYIRHVPKCVEANRGKVQEALEERREWAKQNPLVAGEALDPEAMEFVERQRRE